MAPKMTHDEHEARAMLMGMKYHHGNGEPFYYVPDELGIPIVNSMVDANTLVPFVGAKETELYRRVTYGYLPKNFQKDR